MFKTDGRPIEKYNEVSFQLSEIPSIVAATPQIQGQVMATSSRNALGAVVRGLSGQIWLPANHLGQSITMAIASFRDEGGILIGETMAFQLGVKLAIRSAYYLQRDAQPSGLYPHAEPIKLLVCSK